MESTVKEICQETKWGRGIPSVTFGGEGEVVSGKAYWRR